MNFGVLMRILITRMNTGQKVKILQTQDGGRHIENGFIAISQPRIIRCRWNRCPDAHFGSKNGHVSKKNKIFKIRHIENRLLAISQRFIVQLTRNLVHRSRITLRHRLHNQIPNFENSRWRMAAILKMVLLLYFTRKSSDLNEIWYVDADCASKVGYLTKC